MRLKTRLAERFRPRHGPDAERFGLPMAEDEIARLIPSLPWHDDDLNRIEPIKRDALNLAAAERILDDHPLIRKPVLPAERVLDANDDARKPR